MKIELIPFEQAFISVPVGKRKIPEKEYDVAGTICVVDQGQKLISGHTDRNDLAIDDGPYIVFGDHTRIVKYVDFPFVAGADGVRLFKAATNFQPEFLYLFLKSSEIPSDGYGRHSKYLKDLLVPNLNTREQNAIVMHLNAQLHEVETARSAALQQLIEIESLPKILLAKAFKHQVRDHA